jgi:hypothetical protein
MEESLKTCQNAKNPVIIIQPQACLNTIDGIECQKRRENKSIRLARAYANNGKAPQDLHFMF